MRRIFNKVVRAIIKKSGITGLEQDLNTRLDKGQITVESIVPLARQAAAEGIVLLKNEKQTLPIKREDRVAVFGRTAINYFGVGYGSGGDVQRPYLVNLMEGLANANVNVNEKLADVYKEWTSIPKNQPDEGFWGHWPMSFPEMPLTSDIVEEAAKESDIAIVVIGRAAGEARENILKKGSYYLTNLEMDMLNRVTKAFDKVAVVMDCGNIIDMSWVEDYKNRIGAIVYAWLGGMESGNALVDILTAKVNPCGKLTDTIANSYETIPSANDFGDRKYNNYTEDIYVGYRYFETFAPEKVLYPFGFGLSYTSFEILTSAEIIDTKISLNITVTNTGNNPGKEVVQAYLSQPQGLLGKPSKVLVGFSKTDELKPDESQDICIGFDLFDFASYDESGIIECKSSFVLEEGEYKVFVGNSVRNSKEVTSKILQENIVTKQLSEVLAVEKDKVFKRLVNKKGQEIYEDVPTVTTDLKQIILENLPKDIPYAGDKGIKFDDVISGSYSTRDFVAQLSPQELDDLSHGEGQMNSALGIIGNAGAFGGVTESLRNKGIPPIITADGPSGIRIRKTCSLLPCGTALASSFNKELITELYSVLGEEVKHYEIDVLLAPGMNIHRNPLCGRNFEYFSEDPLLSGYIGAAFVKGLQSVGVSACPKHFAVNNQERNRNSHDSRISERALREIYLKNFEYMIKESNPDTIMASYNKVNGVWSHYSYELATSILRKEWNYEGLILTDWWMQSDSSPEFPAIINDAYRIRSQVDVLMPGADNKMPGKKIGRHLLDTYKKPEGITLGEMQLVAINLLEFILKIKKP